MELDLEKLRGTAVANFNRSISWLITTALKYNPGDAEIEKIRGKMSIAKGADSESLIRECGPYLVKYQKLINARDEEFFLKNDPVELGELDDSARTLLTRTRQQFRSMKEKEKAEIWRQVSTLLSSYLEFLVTEQSLGSS